ncbi:MAG: hypothetical protein MZV64_09110 [Ignavibacteriales bacterium]|nr:hypothetical protein [Ignavibacteriales bacterium]
MNSIFVNNVGTSTIYKFNFSDLDGDGSTPVPTTVLVGGSAELPSDPNTDSPEEIASLLFYDIPTEGAILTKFIRYWESFKKTL